jgi:hypothetical protein
MSRWKAERKLEAGYKDLDDLPKLSKGDDGTILDFIEEFPEKLAQIIGTDGRPLGYVIRDDETPPLAVHDPLFGEPNCRYPSVRDEVIARAPIGVPGGRTYSADNKHVFEILRDAIADHDEVKSGLKGLFGQRTGEGHGQLSKPIILKHPSSTT